MADEMNDMKHNHSIVHGFMIRWSYLTDEQRQKAWLAIFDIAMKLDALEQKLEADSPGSK